VDSIFPAYSRGADVTAVDRSPLRCRAVCGEDSDIPDHRAVHHKPADGTPGGHDTTASVTGFVQQNADHGDYAEHNKTPRDEIEHHGLILPHPQRSRAKGSQTGQMSAQRLPGRQKFAEPVGSATGEANLQLWDRLATGRVAVPVSHPDLVLQQGDIGFE
jgi:hypothetical protein